MRARMERTPRVALALRSGLAGGAVLLLVGAVQLTIVVPLRTEWSAAQRKTYDNAIDLIRHRSPSEMPIVLDVLRLQLDCFPTKAEWAWARLRHSADQVEFAALRDHRACLVRSIAGATRVRAWNPPQAGGV